MYIDKVLLMIIFCATSAWCSNRTLTRNTRTIDLSSFFTWPQTLFGNRLSNFQFKEWTRSNVVNFLRLISVNEKPMRIEFRPEDGPRAAKTYEERYGYRGEWLIEQLGNGLGPNDLNRLDKWQPVPCTFLKPPILPFKGSDKNFF